MNRIGMNDDGDGDGDGVVTTIINWTGSNSFTQNICLLKTSLFPSASPSTKFHLKSTEKFFAHFMFDKIKGEGGG